MTNQRADDSAAQRLLLTDLVPLLDGYGITADIHQPGDDLEPWIEVRYGTVHTSVEVHRGLYIAFGGMPQGQTYDPDGAARRIAWLCGVPGVPASGSP